jgi:hypothetical protein
MREIKIKFTEYKSNWGIIDVDYYSEAARALMIKDGYMKQFLISAEQYGNARFVEDEEIYCMIYTESISSAIPGFVRLPQAVELLEKLRTGVIKKFIFYGEDMDFLTVGGPVPHLVKELNDFFGEQIDKVWITIASKNWSHDWGNINVVYNLGCLPYFLENNIEKIEKENIVVNSSKAEKHFYTTNNQPREARLHLYKHLLENRLMSKCEASFFFRHHQEQDKRYLVYSDRERDGDKVLLPDIDDSFQFPTRIFDNEVEGSYFFNCKWVNFPKNNNALIDLVIETLSDPVNFCSLTEKTFRPIICKKPFLVFGSAGLYKGLEEMGFKLFPQLYDSSILDDTTEFDELMWEMRHEDKAKAEFYKIRFTKFLKILDRLADMDIEQLRELVEETYFNCEYNYQVLLGIIKKEKEDTLKLFSL